LILSGNLEETANYSINGQTDKVSNAEVLTFLSIMSFSAQGLVVRASASWPVDLGSISSPSQTKTLTWYSQLPLLVVQHKRDKVKISRQSSLVGSLGKALCFTELSLPLSG